MSNQTPPVVPVSEDQYAKWLQVTQDRIRKGNIDLQTFQYILGHPELVPQLEKMFTGMTTEYRRTRPLIERHGQKLQLGVRKSSEEMRQALLAKGCQISNLGGDILNRITLVSAPMEIEVIEATNAELGYPNGCTVAQTCEAGLKLGWELCEHEVGPECLLQDLDLPNGSVAMKPIADSDGRLRVFGVEHDDDGRWLSGYYGHPDYFYYGDDVWLFRRK